MSVLIKGMEMPKSCGECFLDYDSIVCMATDKEFPNRSSDDGFDAYCNTRMPDCPLVEVPTPHGRLIDADALYEEVDNIWYGRSLPTLGATVLAKITIAPTVIEAVDGE